MQSRTPTALKPGFGPFRAGKLVMFFFSNRIIPCSLRVNKRLSHSNLDMRLWPMFRREVSLTIETPVAIVASLTFDFTIVTPM